MYQLVVAQEITSSIYFAAPRRPGDTVWVRTQDIARHLIEAGICTWPQAKAEKPPVAEKPKAMRRPDGWPVDRFAVVQRAWAGEPVVCIGGGPSVTQEAVDLTKGRARVIAINDAYLLAPWADICYFADARWWEWHKEKPEFKAFQGQKVTIGHTGLQVSDPEVFMLQNGGSDKLSERPNAIHTGSNGGYQAVNIAFLAGGNPILLIGYDMKYVGAKSHWHGGHPVKTSEGAYTSYARNFAGMLPQLAQHGVRVVNCTPGSRIDCFPRDELARLLADSR